VTSEPSSVDDELWALMTKASDHAINSLEAGGPLIPFSLATSEDGLLHLQRYAAGDPQAWLSWDDVARSVEAGRRTLATEDSAAAVFAWQGTLDREGSRIPAVIVEGQRRGHGRSVVLAQPFREEPGAVPEGPPVRLPDGPPLMQ
jgi:hypothetical protein